jgi:signal peptidase
VGRVVFTLPFVGHVVQFVGTPLGFVALVIVPLGLLIASEVADLVRSGGQSDGASGSDGSDDGGDDDGPGPVDGPSPASHAAVGTGDQVVLTPQDLTLSLGALGAFAVYAGYAAFRRPTGLAVGVAVAVGATFLLVAGVRTFAPPSPLPTGEAVVTATRVDDRPATVDLPSVTDLRAVSATVGRPILSDGGRYVVLDGVVTYACPVPTHAESAGDEAPGASDPDGAKTEDSPRVAPEAPPSAVGGAGR